MLQPLSQSDVALPWGTTRMGTKAFGESAGVHSEEWRLIDTVRAAAKTCLTIGGKRAKTRKETRFGGIWQEASTPWTTGEQRNSGPAVPAAGSAEKRIRPEAELFDSRDNTPAVNVQARLSVPLSGNSHG